MFVKKKTVFKLVLSVVLGVVFFVTPIKAYAAPKIGTYMFYWWICPPGETRNCRKDWMPFVPPHIEDQGYLHPDNVQWWSNSLDDMISSGIDYVFPVVWHDCSIDVLKNLVTAATGKNIKVGFFGTPVAEEGEDLNANLDYYYNDIYGKFFRIIPRDMWATENGRPLIVTYVSVGTKGDLAAFVSGLKSKFKAEFGVEPFVILDQDWFSHQGISGVADGKTQWGAACANDAYIQKHNGYTVANIGPGEDTSKYKAANPEHGLCVSSREGGDKLERQFNQAKNSNLILVESWNELYEGTGIERGNYPEGETFYMEKLKSLVGKGSNFNSPNYSVNNGVGMSCSFDENLNPTRPSRITDLYGRDPYNRIMAMGNSRYFPWNFPYSPAISSDQYNKNSFPLGSDDYKFCLRAGARSGELSCPDYSPNRPLPGDSSLDFLDTHNEDETDLTKYQMKDFQIGGVVSIPLCSKSTGTCLTDIPIQSTAGENAVYNKGFIDFLGTNNEYTSNPNYIMSLKNNISRTALFLIDFLGGMADIPGVTGRSHEIKDYIDAYLKYQADISAAGNNQTLMNLANAEYQAKISAIPNLKENLQLTSGLLGKAITSNAKMQADKQEQTLAERWALNNIPHDLNAGKYASNTDPSLMPVGDYVIAYKCAEGDGVLSNEEDFPDSLERRDAMSARTKAKCGDQKIIPIRISDYVCSASNPQIWNSIKDKFKYTDPKTGATKSFDKKDICRGKEDPIKDTLKKWSASDLEVLKQYFVTGQTHEDVPVRVVLQCPTNYTSPGVEGKEIAPGVAFFSNELDEGEMRQKGVDRYAFGGQYDAANKVYNFTTVTRTYIYVGHLAEAREQTYNTNNLLFPASFQEEQKSAMSLASQAQINAIDFAKEKLPTFNTDIAKSITAKASLKGDLIAEDSKNRLDPLGDASQLTNYQIAKKPELTQRDQERIDEWLLKDPLTRGGGPAKDVALTANCKINVEIPYIQETAARTIGDQHGFYRLFFSKAEQKIIDDQIASADTKGAAVASSQYTNISAGNGTATTDQKFFIPWVDAMKTWNSALNFGVNPLAAQKASSNNNNNNNNPPPDTTTGPYQTCLVAGVNFHDTSVGDLKSSAIGSAFDKMRKTYTSSAISGAFNGIDGKTLWDNLIDTSVSGNMNPYLALAYWGEETNFNSPINPDARKGLGCGIISGLDANGHHNSCIAGNTDQEKFINEFKCFAATGSSCNQLCSSQTSTLGFVGCYQYGAGKQPGDTYLTNLMYFYHLLKGDTAPVCPK